MRYLIWLAAGIAIVLITLLIFFPVAWVVPIIEQQSAGRLTLGDAHGTLWQGSAYLGGAANKRDPVTPLLPGRFSWRLSPAILFGSLEAELENTAVLPQPVRVTGSWRHWQISAGQISLPAERLAALGAPLNTILPSGEMRLSWQPLQLTQQRGHLEMAGAMKLEMNDIASRLSPVKPLGSYDLALDWHGIQATVTLKTVRGPMILDGSGILDNGHLQFSGTARAEAEQEQRLANFLNLLGQRHREGNTDIIALEFK